MISLLSLSPPLSPPPQDMGEKQAEMDEIQEMYEQEVAQLNELQERFNRLEVEYNVIMEERKQERERREAAESELQSMVKAAILIQSLWRAYKCRKVCIRAHYRGAFSRSHGS